MIVRILWVARRECVEIAREPATVLVLVVTWLLVGGATLAAGVAMEFVASSDAQLAAFADVVGDDRLDPRALVDWLAGGVIRVWSFLLFSQLLGMAGVFAGHTVLHDRQLGTLPFLLLSPIRRGELLAGKVLGAVSPALLPYVVIGGGASLGLATLQVSGPSMALLPGAPAWWVAFALGGPSWAVAVGAACAVVSSTTRDVRGAQQAVWLVVLVATTLTGGLLSWALPLGVGAQLVAASIALGAAGVCLWAGASLLGRDLDR